MWIRTTSACLLAWLAAACGSGPGTSAPDSAPDAGRDASAVVDAAGVPATDAGAPGADASTPASPAGPPSSIVESDPLAAFQRGEPQRQRICARGADDLVIDVFCGDAPPDIQSLADLQAALGIDPTDVGGTRAFALTTHSTALSTRSVSALNPRALFVHEAGNGQEMLVLGFVRGEHFSEAVVRDRVTGELQFYVFSFALACDEAPGGCTPGDLFTPAAESGWSDVSLYDDEDLADSVLDCRQCHQPGGPGTPMKLRMQELDLPWTHWIWQGVAGGAALLEDYRAAKGDEGYAGIPSKLLYESRPGHLATLVRQEGDGDQPNVFDSATIKAELEQTGHSDTWQAIYEQSRAGLAIPVPYYGLRVTDPGKLANLTGAYQAFSSGELPADQLPDLRDIYPDDPAELAAMGFTTEPGLSAQDALVQACGQCHNARLDPSLSRAKFDVDLTRTSAKVRQKAIERLRLPRSDPGAMPPPRFRDLRDDVRDQLVDLLSQP